MIASKTQEQNSHSPSHSPVSGTCQTCKHARTVDPKGSWGRYGFDHAIHVHCAFTGEPRLSEVRSKFAFCRHEPSKWEAND
jgi:hypothetical protein